MTREQRLNRLERLGYPILQVKGWGATAVFTFQRGNPDRVKWPIEANAVEQAEAALQREVRRARSLLALVEAEASDDSEETRL